MHRPSLSRSSRTNAINRSDRVFYKLTANNQLHLIYHRKVVEMAAEVKYFMIACVALSCISVGFSAAIPGKKPIDPDHVPSSVCVSMVPAHGDHEPSTDPVPYTVTTSKREVAPGETIQVFVSGKDGANFKGLYLQARVVGAGADAVGQFSLDNQKTNSAIRVSDCPPGSENALSYISREGIGSLVLDWKAPESATGAIYFRATLVERRTTFWIDVNSESITITNTA